jgi:methyl-accepting chemotaxis protein
MSSDDVIHMLARANSTEEDEDLVFDDDEEDEDDDVDAELRPGPNLIYIQQTEQDKPPAAVLPEKSPPPKNVTASPIVSDPSEGSNADKAVSPNKEDHDATKAASSVGIATTATDPSSTEGFSAVDAESPHQPVVSFQEPVKSPQSSIIQQSPQSPPGVAASYSDMTSQPTDSPKGHSVVTIEHASVSSTPRSALFLFGMSKPVFAAVAFIMLFTTGSAAFFLSQYIRIPGLDSQIAALENEVNRLEEQLGVLQEEIDRLTVEVDRLGTEVNRLGDENDRLVVENDRLEVENEEFTELNQQLNASNTFLSTQVEFLTNATEDLSAQNAELKSENAQLANSTEALETQIDELEGQVTNLTIVNLNLVATNVALIIEVVELSQNVTQLEETNDELAQANQNLSQEVDRLEDANSNLQQQVDDLTAILQFINGTVGEIEDSFQEAVDVLTGLIQTNQNILLENLQNSYGITVNAWRCDFQSDFAGEPFIADPNLPIGEPDYPPVISNVETNVLDPLCLDTTNFENYIHTEFLGQPPGFLPPYDVTSNQLNTAVTRYSAAAIDYYFPDEGETGGLTPLDWSDAGFDCKGLPEDLRFMVDFTFNGTAWSAVFSS